MRLFKHSCPEYKIKILDFTYTSEPSINSALPLTVSTVKLVFFVIGCLLSSGFLWLIAKWSSKKKAILIYDVCDVDDATSFLIEEEGIVGGSTIVDRYNKYDIKRRARSVGFSYHERTYLFHPEKEVFLPIRYEELGQQLDKLKKGRYQPYLHKIRKRLLDYYGYNEINLPVQNQIQVFVEEMLTPYEVFQLYAIILWIYEEYYLFSFILLGYSVYTYWDNSSQVIKNQKKLSQQSFFDFKCKIATKDQASFMAVQQENSGDMTIVDEIKTIPGLDDPNFIPLQEEIQPKMEIRTDEQMKTNRSQEGTFRGSSHTLQIVQLNSRDLLPGDILILAQGDTIPCDCLMLSGEALVDEQYLTGESFLVRKSEIQNYTYSKEKQQSFLLYLGTKIVKVRRNRSCGHDESHIDPQMIEQESGTPLSGLLTSKEIACIITQTNYNTQRGKYLRAVRYQKKPTQNFTKETIYFIYIILALTTIVFLILLPVISESQTNGHMFYIFLDILAVSIPMTLPTALSVGINFAQHRLSKAGIHSVLPSNIMAGGRATTIVLDSTKIFGKNYEMNSIMVGIKSNRSIGTTYSSLHQFLDLSNTNTYTESYYDDPLARKRQIQTTHETGKMLVRAFSVCHTLQYYNDSMSGTVEEKQIFSFSQAKYLDEDAFECLNDKIKIKQRIFFREKDRKLAVICRVEDRANLGKDSIVEEVKSGAFDVLSDKMEEQEPIDLQLQLKKEVSLDQKTNHILFIKGPPEKILPICHEETYPRSAHEYVLDMAEKGFKLICFAYKYIDENFNSERDVKKLKAEFNFCGFAILQTERNKDTQKAIEDLRKSRMMMILISQDRELQASSMAIHNHFISKNQLLLCSMRKGKVLCRGHTEWDSSGEGDDVNEFLNQSQEFIRKSRVSLTSRLYQELFMKREEIEANKIFDRSIIYNQMQNRHSRNLYFQLQKRNLVSFAVGSGGSVSECAHLSLELERGECSLLSSFHTESKTLSCITQCLIICRAALATNFHCFSMMILFSLVQFTTVAILEYNYQIITDDQMLYEDLFVTFPIFITINLTLPVSKLSKQLPPSSFFSLRALTSMIGQLVIQFLAQLGFIAYLFSMDSFIKEKQLAKQQYLKTGQFEETKAALATFILTNYLYLGIVLSTSVSKPFRKPFYTNPYYTITLIALWLYNTGIVLIPQMAPSTIRPQDLDKDVQYVLVLAMLLGNLMMMLMYMYENLLVWIWNLKKKMERGHRHQDQ